MKEETALFENLLMSEIKAKTGLKIDSLMTCSGPTNGNTTVAACPTAERGDKPIVVLAFNP